MKESRAAAARICAIYVAVSAVWILASDAAVSLLPPVTASAVQSVKGIAFVFVTGALLYILVADSIDEIAAKTREAHGAEAVLLESLQSVPAGVLMLNDEAIITFMNREAEHLLGVGTEDAVGRSLGELGLSDGGPGQVTVAELLNTGHTEGVRLERPGGERHAMIARATQLKDGLVGAGWVVALVVSEADSASALAVSRMLRGHDFLSQLSVAIARATELRQLLEEACELAVEVAGMQAAWALVHGCDRAISVEEGLGPLAHQAAERIARAMDRDQSMVAVMLGGEVVASNRVAEEVHNPWAEAAKVEGFGSCAALTVDTPTGETVSITFFAPDPDYFDEREIRLLHGVRNALTFAIAKLALDSRRLDAEEALAASERGYHTAFDSLPQPTMVYDIETMRFLAVNEAAISRYGYSRREFLTKSFDDICVMGEAPGHPGTVPKAERELAGEQVWTHRDAQRNEFSVLAFTRPMEWAGKHAEMLVVVEVARVA